MATTVSVRKRLLRRAVAKKESIGISVANRFASFSVLGTSRIVPRTRRNREVIEGTKRQLVYTDKNARPLVIVTKSSKDDGDENRDKEIPKNAIMVFDCVMTTGAKDRDGDVLDPEGAKLDKKMPLLWQHLPFEPVGVLVKIISQDKDGIKARFAILDTKLGRDAAKMVEAGAVRISHGFVPKKIEPLYDDDYEGDGQPPITGFKIEEYDVMECSLVSIPANPEAEILQHERVKFHHPLVKSFISSIKGRREPSRGDRSMSDEKKTEKAAAPVNVHVNLGGLADLLATKDEGEKKPTKEPEGKGKKDDGDDSDIDKLYDIIGRAMDEDDPDKKDELLEEAQAMCRSIKDSMAEDDKDEDEDEDKSKKDGDSDDDDDDEKSTKDGDEDDDDDDDEKSTKDGDDDDDDDDDDSSDEEDSSTEDDSKEQAAGEDDLDPGDSDGRADEDDDDDDDEKSHCPRKKRKKSRNVLDEIFEDEFRSHKPKRRR